MATALRDLTLEYVALCNKAEPTTDTLKQIPLPAKEWFPMCLTTDMQGNVQGVPLAHVKPDLAVQGNQVVLEVGVHDGNGAYFYESFPILVECAAYTRRKEGLKKRFLEVAKYGEIFPGTSFFNTDEFTLISIQPMACQAGSPYKLLDGTYGVRMVIGDPTDRMLQMHPLIHRVNYIKKPLQSSGARRKLSEILKEHKNSWFLLDTSENTRQEFAVSTLMREGLLDVVPLMSSERGTGYPICFTVNVSKNGITVL